MRTLGLLASHAVAFALALAVAAGCSGAPRSSPGQPHTSGVTVGAAAPDAQLTDAAGTRVALAGVLQRRAETVVVFYRGFW